MLPRHVSCSDLSPGASGDADVKIMGTVVEFGSFLKRTYFEAPVFLTGHPGHFQMVVHLSLPFTTTLVQRSLKDGNPVLKASPSDFRSRDGCCEMLPASHFPSALGRKVY